MRRRRLALGALLLLLLGSCTAAGLSLAGGRDRAGSGSGTVTARADVDGSGRAAAPAGPGTPPAGPALASPSREQVRAVGRGTGAGSPARAAGGSATTVTGDLEQPVLVTLSGSAHGLVPGRQGQLLRVVVSNDAANDEDLLLTLRSVSAAARGPAGSCGPEDLVVTPYRAGPDAPIYRVRRGGSVVVPLQVVLVDRLDRDQTDCAGAAFPLTLTATAEVTA